MTAVHYSSAVLLAASVAWLGASGCAQVRSEASGDAGASAGGASAAGAAAGSASAGAPLGPSIEIEHADCATRPVSDCVGVLDRYDSNGGFDDTPAFAHCSAFNSFDGCAEFTFLFDDAGCATSVALGPQVVRDGDHLVDLRGCLADALQAARWPCLVDGRLRYEESCLIR